jgi:hypothetical protein
MSAFAPLFENLWCLVLLLVFAALIFAAAAIVARAERQRITTVGFPEASYPTRRLAASAPLEALASLHARILELQRRRPVGTDDARWLLYFARRLRQAMDEAYARLDAAPPPLQNKLLERLGVEVAALASVVNLQLGAAAPRGADRQALEAQLAALRAATRG